jgi:hypothetical protein
MTAIANHPHRVTSAVADARTSLASVNDVPLWSMDPDETTATIDQLASLAAQVAELQTRLLSHADRAELPSVTGAASTANWHAHRTRTTRPAAHRMMRLAQGLETHDLTRTALAAGRIHVDQADVILRAFGELPADLDPELLTGAEAHLVEQAAQFDPKALKVLGRRILEVIDPDAADAHEAKLLEKEERDAQAATRLTVWDDGHGKLHGRFTIDSGLSGAIFKKALFAFAAPKHQASKGPLGERLPTPERLGQAFVEMIRRYPAKKLPKAGGLNATVVVLMSLETLMGDLRAAHLDTGETISPGAARRLACEAGIIPAVLDGKSQVLDLGRKKRFYSEGPADRQDHRNRRLRSRGLRAPGHVPAAPPHPLGRRRRDQPRRHHDLPVPSLARPRLPLHDDQTLHRQDRLPPAHVIKTSQQMLAPRNPFRLRQRELSKRAFIADERVSLRPQSRGRTDSVKRAKVASRDAVTHTSSPDRKRANSRAMGCPVRNS